MYLMNMINIVIYIRITFRALKYKTNIQLSRDSSKNLTTRIFFISIEILGTFNFDKFELSISNNTYLEAIFYSPSTSSYRDCIYI